MGLGTRSARRLPTPLQVACSVAVPRLFTCCYLQGLFPWVVCAPRLPTPLMLAPSSASGPTSWSRPPHQSVSAPEPGLPLTCLR